MRRRQENTFMEKKRDTSVDLLKGYACFLVVLGHVLMGVRKAGVYTPAFFVGAEDFIWTFHVGLFMFLSGYVYSITGGYKSKGSRLKFLGHKLLNLGVPYLSFSIIYIVLNSLMGGAVNTGMQLKDIFFLWKTPVAQYWFLYSLFILFVIYVAAGKLFSNTWIITVLFAIGLIGSIMGFNFSSFNSAILLAAAFGVGILLKKLYIDKWKVSHRLLIVSSHLVLISLYVFFRLDRFWLMKQVAIFYGVAASIAFISLLGRIDFIKRGLLFICRYSFPIYLLHTIFTAGARIVLMKVGIWNYPLHLIVGLVFGIVFPVLAAVIAEKTKILNFFFYPSRTIRELKKTNSAIK